MKNISTYLPFLFVAIAGVLGVYFFYYKPKQDKAKADKAAVQAESDKALMADNPTRIAMNQKLANLSTKTALKSILTLGQ